MTEKKKFIIRAIVWSIFAGFAPFGFICWRYSLFTKVDRVSFGGWGILAIIVLAIFLFVLIRYIKAGFVGYSMTKQVINGITKVILPLSIIALVCIAIRNSMDYFIQSLGATILSETIAIPINPFPKWIEEKTQGKTESLMDVLVQKLKGGEK